MMDLRIALWSLPVTMLLFGAAHIPIAMLVLPAFAGRLIWRLARTGARDVAANEVTAAPAAPSPPGRVFGAGVTGVAGQSCLAGRYRRSYMSQGKSPQAASHAAWGDELNGGRTLGA